MKKNRKFQAALIIFSLTGQIAWVVENMYFNVFIYKMFRASASDIALMVTASAIAATLTTILMGALSDRIGKRKIFMCAGYIAWGISIISFALIRKDVISSLFGMVTGAATIGITLVIIMDCVMTFFGSTANDAAYNAWLTDSTDATNRGAAEGINSMMPLISILVVFGGFMGFDLDQASSWTTIYCIIGGLVLLIGILGFFLVEEAPVRNPDSLGYFATILYGFRPDVIRKNAVLYFSMAAFILFNISIQIYMPYLIIYYEQTLGMADYVLIMAPAIILAAAVTFFFGKLIDRFGFRKTVLPAVFLLALGFVLLWLVPSVIPAEGMAMKIPVFIGSFLMMTLVGLIIGTLVNLFFHFTWMESLITYAGLFIFVGLTAYDTQKIKNALAYSEAAGLAVDTRKIALMGALNLYLDFVNLFLYILRLLGSRRS